MNQYIAKIALLVKDYDEAINYYTRILNFQLIEDTTISKTKRWVVLAPQGSDSCQLLLAKAVTKEQRHAIGNQSGGRVFLFLYTDDFERDYQRLVDHNVTIVREKSIEKYGKVAVFSDLYGNLWDLIEPSAVVQSSHS